MADEIKSFFEYVNVSDDTNKIEFGTDIKTAVIHAVDSYGNLITNYTDAAGRRFYYSNKQALVILWIEGDIITRITVVKKNNFQTLECNKAGDYVIEVKMWWEMCD